MKKKCAIIFLLALIFVIYISVDTLFEIFTEREIIYCLLASVVFLMIYFSLKLCGIKKNK